jgi:hypothetical protein
VRAVAAASLGRLGAAAVPALRRLVWEPGGDPSTVAGCVLTLALTGPEGIAELNRVAAAHPEEKVRRLARFALGRDLGRH